MNVKNLVLKSQKELKVLKQNKEYLITKARFGPSKETKIPLYLDENLAFFVATIIGDGNLKKAKLQISIELSDKKLIEYIRETCLNLFNRSFNIHPVIEREGKKQTYQMVMDNKSIYCLLNKVFNIPIGKKSNIVCVPNIIKKSNKSIKSAFIIGIMLTEGGKRRRGVGMSTASKMLWEDLSNLFEDVGIKVSKDRWIYKKYNKEYYGLYFKIDKIHFILEGCKNKELKDIFEQIFAYGLIQTNQK